MTGTQRGNAYSPGIWPSLPGRKETTDQGRRQARGRHSGAPIAAPFLTQLPGVRGPFRHPASFLLVIPATPESRATRNSTRPLDLGLRRGDVFSLSSPGSSLLLVIPAQAGIQGNMHGVRRPWTPAFAGVTQPVISCSVILRCPARALRFAAVELGIRASKDDHPTAILRDGPSALLRMTDMPTRRRGASRARVILRSSSAKRGSASNMRSSRPEAGSASNMRTAGHREPASDFEWAASRRPARSCFRPLPRLIGSSAGRL
jgi:hypothetical protein